jgi:nucleotide-binding universal stress UspA family protein
MSELTFAVAAGAWIVEAFVLAYLMGRRGYQAGVWLFVGVVCGPIGVLLALSAALRPPAHEPRLLHAGSRRGGPIDVLIGIDRSSESAAAVDRVLSLFGHGAGRVTLARVIPIDASLDVEREAAAELADARASHPQLDPSTVVLRGDPASALRDYVRRLGYEVLVIGTRGDGRTRSPLGSVALALARGAGIPVLLVDDASTDRRATSADDRTTSR